MASYYSSYSNEYRLRLDITQGTQSTTNNTSVVSWNLYLLSGNKSFSVYSTYHATVNGVASPNTTQTNVNIGFNTSVKLGSGSTTVTHNADGTKSVPFSASFKTNSPAYSGGVLITPGTMTISGNFALTTIPRYAAITAFTASINDRSATLSWTADKTISQWRWSSNSGSSYSGWITVNANSGSYTGPTIPGRTYGFRIQVKNSASGLITTSSVVNKTATKTRSTLTLSTTSQNVGSNITWTINESYDYTHTLTASFGNTSQYILGGATSETALNTSTGTWTVPTAWANQIPNATSGSGTIRLRTYYGNVFVGERFYTFTAKVPNNTTWQPTVPNVAIEEAVTQPGNITSYVQGKSKAKVTSTSTAQGGASIKSYRVTVSGIGTYYGSNVTSGTLNKSGTVTVTVRATDSRGYYREKSNTITVVAYSPPKLTTYTALRSPNNQGTDLATSINFSISSVSSQNTKQYRIRYRPTGGTWVSLVDSTGYYTRSTTHSATDVLDANSSYQVEFYIKDSYTSVTQTRSIGTAFQLLDFNASGRGVAFGKVSEGNTFEVALPTILHRQTMLRGNSSGIENTTFLQFMESDGSTRQGFVGFGEGIDGTFHIYNEFGSRILMNRNLYISGNLTWHAGNSNVIETSGSNANGSYIKFSDGTMICTRTVTFDNTSDYAINFSFPSTFTAVDFTGKQFDANASTLSAVATTRYNNALVYPGSVAYWSVRTRSPVADTSFGLKLFAIGRWK